MGLAAFGAFFTNSSGHSGSVAMKNVNKWQQDLGEVSSLENGPSEKTEIPVNLSLTLT
jgi:hypothetical protein